MRSTRGHWVLDTTRNLDLEEGALGESIYQKETEVCRGAEPAAQAMGKSGMETEGRVPGGFPRYPEREQASGQRWWARAVDGKAGGQS